MKVNYGACDGIMHNNIKLALENRDHPLGANPAYPTLKVDETRGNFEQQCANKRFADLILKYQEAANLTEFNGDDLVMKIVESVINSSYGKIGEISEAEAPHYEQLENLAIDIVCKDFNIQDGDIIFNVKIKPVGEISFPLEMKADEESSSSQPEISEENYFYDVDDEISKRRFINALISGASKKGHYIFHLGKDELNTINPKLTHLYQIMMSANDLVYYIMDDQIASLVMQGGDGTDNYKAGFEKLTFNENGIPVITVEAVNFPVLLHELIKAVVELIATLSLPNDKELLEYVYDQSDYVLAEMWYLRLGPVFWERLLSCFPPEYFQLKSQLLGKVFELETDDFNSLMKSALSTDNQDSAKKFLRESAKIIYENIRDYNQRN